MLTAGQVAVRQQDRGVGGCGVGHAFALPEQLRQRLLGRGYPAGCQLGEPMVEQRLGPPLGRGARAHEPLEIERCGLECTELVPRDPGPVGELSPERGQPVPALDQIEGLERVLIATQVVQGNAPAEVDVRNRLGARVADEKRVVDLHGERIVAVGHALAGLVQELSLVGPEGQGSESRARGHGEAYAGAGHTAPQEVRHPYQQVGACRYVPLHPSY